MIKFRFRGNMKEIPGCVEELNIHQYERYLYLALALSSGMIDVAQARTRLISLLLGLSVNYTRMLPDIIEEIEAQASAINEFFDGERLIVDTPKNLLPEYEGYKGPADWLEGLPFGRFVEITAIIDSIRDSSEVDATAGYASIARILYNIPLDKQVPPLLAAHAPLLFNSVWRLIQTQPLNINGNEIDFRIIFRSSGGSRKADDNTGFTGIMFEIAREGVFGPLKDVEACDFWKVMLYLYKCKFEYLHDKNAHG